MIQPALTSGRQLLRKVFIWPHRARSPTLSVCEFSSSPVLTIAERPDLRGTRRHVTRAPSRAERRIFCAHWSATITESDCRTSAYTARCPVSAVGDTGYALAPLPPRPPAISPSFAAASAGHGSTCRPVMTRNGPRRCAGKSDRVQPAALTDQVRQEAQDAALPRPARRRPARPRRAPQNPENRRHLALGRGNRHRLAARPGHPAPHLNSTNPSR